MITKEGRRFNAYLARASVGTGGSPEWLGEAGCCSGELGICFGDLGTSEKEALLSEKEAEEPSSPSGGPWTLLWFSTLSSSSWSDMLLPNGVQSWDTTKLVLGPDSVLECLELASMLCSSCLSLFPRLSGTSGSFRDLAYRDEYSESGSGSRVSPYFSASCRLLSALYLAILSALDSRLWVSTEPKLWMPEVSVQYLEGVCFSREDPGVSSSSLDRPARRPQDKTQWAKHSHVYECRVCHTADTQRGSIHKAPFRRLASAPHTPRALCSASIPLYFHVLFLSLLFHMRPKGKFRFF